MLKSACPQCTAQGRDTAGDNLYTFDSGVQYCVACGETINVIGRVLMPKTEMLDGIYTNIRSRKISKKTCEFYGYMINAEKRVHIANYYDDVGTLVMQQHRTTDKQFPIFGDHSYKDQLWGLSRFNPDERVFITITEGQIDALSVAEAFDCKYPVVSLPNGCSAAAKVISKHMHILDKFKYVVLAFDNDEPGRKATEECRQLFEPGKIKIAKWPQKDASDLLQQGLVKEIRDVIYGAVEVLPAPILTGDALLNTLKDYKPKSCAWPWKTANDVINPIYIPGIYTIAALSGVGKTILMADLMRSQIEQGAKVGVISLEESIPNMLIKLTSAITGIDLKKIRNRQLTNEEIEQCRSTANSIVTYDHRTYSSDLISILDNLPYIAQSLNCQFIIFDNLSYSAAGMAEDERRNLDKAMKLLKDSSTKYEYTLFNVVHLNDDSYNVEKSTMRGSRGLLMFSDSVIYLSRDVESQDPLLRNTLRFYVKKDRASGEDSGKSFQLYYNHERQRLEDFK